MISLTDIVNDPDFAQDYVVTRRYGVFALGAFQVTSSVTVPFWGIIQPATDEDLDMVPEGDRVRGLMSFISEQEMFKTNGNGLEGVQELGDLITWNNQVYKIVVTTIWKDFGFFKALGVRQSGE